jgi:alginate O-acetyltransferase complex protein AlgI
LELRTIIIAIGIALLYRWFGGRWRRWLLLVTSVITLFWLSSTGPTAGYTFVLPALTIGLTILVWWFTRPADTDRRETLYTLGITAVVLLIAAYVIAAQAVIPSVIVLLIAGGIGAVISRGEQRPQWSVLALIAGIVAIFVMLKTPAINTQIAGILTGPPDPDNATPAPFVWLGFSYIAFRLLHVLLDWRSGRLQAVSLREMLTYITFFPALAAGPIDRVERFAADYRDVDGISSDVSVLQASAERIALGTVKKFIVADTIARLTFGSIAIDNLASPLAGWIILYVYGFQLYLDFSGYTDIAIGIGMLLGIRLPENFDQPYLKQNIAAFWQSWHITLSNWARFYIFSPLSRYLLKRQSRPPMQIIVFAAQLSTMLVIGLWHGVSWPFVVWGLWHGIGLFIHKVWSDRTRQTYLQLQSGSWQKRAWTAAGWFITFQFVMLGWVWFAIPDVNNALGFMGTLFGVK